MNSQSGFNSLANKENEIPHHNGAGHQMMQIDSNNNFGHPQSMNSHGVNSFEAGLSSQP